MDFHKLRQQLAEATNSTADHVFAVGQNVEFTGKRGQTVRGKIHKINSKTAIVKTHFVKKGRDHSNTHRVPHSVLRKV